MRTIIKLLKYDLSSYEKEALFSCGIINGCGGKGGIDFDKILHDNIKFVPGYDPVKGKRLLEDIKEICIEHDIDYRFKRGFYYSNFMFARKLYLLLRSFGKSKWITKRQAFVISIISFVLLNRNGKKFYS